MNWGDPRGRGSLCDDYLPVVYVPGDLTLLGGFGQGVLVVEGNLSVRGDLTLEGLVIVGRGLHAESTARIVGAVRVGARGHGVVRRTGEGRVEFSPCAVDRALTAIAPARPLSSRGWFLALE